MVEEKQQEQKPSILDELRSERDSALKSLEELRQMKTQLEELRVREFLGGQTDAGQAPQRQVELTPKEYVKAIREGRIKPTPLIKK